MVTEKRKIIDKKQDFCGWRENVYVNKKIHIHKLKFSPIWMWIMWITYFPRRCSPTFTMSPAPIVINKSPFIQFFNKNFSISSKEGK